MEPIKLIQSEVEALLIFLKDYINKDNLSAYNGSTIRDLFLAYVKLQNAKEEWEEVMKYTE